MQDSSSGVFCLDRHFLHLDKHKQMWRHPSAKICTHKHEFKDLHAQPRRHLLHGAHECRPEGRGYVTTKITQTRPRDQNILKGDGLRTREKIPRGKQGFRGLALCLFTCIYIRVYSVAISHLLPLHKSPHRTSLSH